MHVLVAVDGSPGSEVAVDLAASLEWPAGTVMRFVSAVIEVQDYGYDLVGMLPVDTDDQPFFDELEQALEHAKSRMGDQVTTGCAIVHGRPADAILADAEAFEPDLIVVGSRGYGPIRSMLLGSVSAELVDRSPCPVLVARRPTIEHLVLAYDGSPASDRALELLGAWPILRSTETQVLSVAQAPVLWRSGVAPGMYRVVIEDYEASLAQLRNEHRQLADQAARRLATGGVTAQALVATGDPAQEIVALTGPDKADLVVIGSRGHTGLSRLVLGSVARNVLLHADASVLVVHALPEGEVERVER
jgi:nucleotide-binding universal stress UspA family protein